MIKGVREKYAAIFGEIEGVEMEVDDLFGAGPLSKPRDKADAENVRRLRMQVEAEDKERDDHAEQREVVIRSLDSLSIDTSVSWEFERERRNLSQAPEFGKDRHGGPDQRPVEVDTIEEKLHMILDTSSLHGLDAKALAAELQRIRNAMADRLRQLDAEGRA